VLFHILKIFIFKQPRKGDVNLNQSAVKVVYLLVSKYICGVSATREHIIDLADTVIRQKGFNSFSYADIAVVLNIRNAAIHYHFATKSLLGQAVIYEEIMRLEDYRHRNAGLAGHLQLKHLIQTFYHNSLRHAICLMGALTPEFATFDADMQSILRRLCIAIRDWVRECLEKARTAGKLAFQGTAGDRAALVVSTLLSSLLLSRIEGEGLFPRMLDQLLADLGADWRIHDLPAAEPPDLEQTHSFT
jgi:AcrR family transcriptional regulator